MMAIYDHHVLFMTRMWLELVDAGLVWMLTPCAHAGKGCVLESVYTTPYDTLVRAFCVGLTVLWTLGGTTACCACCIQPDCILVSRSHGLMVILGFQGALLWDDGEVAFDIVQCGA
jgi:hypothetical protein